MDDDEVQKAHIKGQLQGLRAALRAQPNGIVAAGAPAVAAAVPTAMAPRLAAPSRNGVLAAPQPVPPSVPPSHTPAPAARPFQPPPPSAQAFQLSPPAPPAAPSGRRETVSAAAPAVSQPPPRARAASPRVSRPAAPVAAAPAPRAVSPAPRSLSPAPSRSNAGAVGGAGGTPVKPSAGRKGGGKSDCVAKVEEMQKQREERRRRPRGGHKSCRGAGGASRRSTFCVRSTRTAKRTGWARRCRGRAATCGRTRPPAARRPRSVYACASGRCSSPR